jgi:leucyl-tRNA synthetase
MELFIGPWNQMANWSVEGMGGSFRFLQRVWNLVKNFQREKSRLAETTGNQAELEVQLNTMSAQATKKVTTDIETLGFNTAIAALMEYVNGLYKLSEQLPFGTSPEQWLAAIERLLLLLAPFAPHITEELWQELGRTTSVHLESWPGWDEKYLVSTTKTIVVQVNGKVRANIVMEADASAKAMEEAARSEPNVAKYLKAKTEVKTITVPSKLVNFVIKE